MSDKKLSLEKVDGALLGSAKPGDVHLYADMDGNIKKVDENGDEVAVSAAGDDAEFAAIEAETVTAVILSPTSEDEPYEAADSYQPVAPDLHLSAASGSDDGTDPSFLAAVMGNVLGDGVQGEGNYIAGVIGAVSVTDASSDYPVAGIMGVVMDGAEGVDGAVVAVIDGSDPSAVTKPRAAFAVRMNNNNAASGADYGLDLHDAGNAHYSGGGEPFNVKNAEIRMSTQACVLTGAADPTDGVTGATFAEAGSLYIRQDGADSDAFINCGTMASPVWKRITREA